MDAPEMPSEPAVEGREEAVPADVRRESECARENDEAVEGREETLPGAPLRFGRIVMLPLGE